MQDCAKPRPSMTMAPAFSGHEDDACGGVPWLALPAGEPDLWVRTSPNGFVDGGSALAGRVAAGYGIRVAGLRPATTLFI
jgi:hypothetical protein